MAWHTMGSHRSMALLPAVLGLHGTQEVGLHAVSTESMENAVSTKKVQTNEVYDMVGVACKKW